MQTDYNASYHEKNSSFVPNDELSLDHPPRGIKMEHTFDGTIVIKSRTISAEAFPLFYFALITNAFASILMCAAITITAEKFGWQQPFPFFTVHRGSFWPVWIIGSIFSVLGLSFTYATLFNFFGRCEIRLSANMGSVFSGFGPLGRTQHFSPQSIKSIGELKTEEEIGGRPIYRLAIFMNNGREIKFPGLGKMRETWLVFALGKILHRA